MKIKTYFLRKIKVKNKMLSAAILFGALRVNTCFSEDKPDVCSVVGIVGYSKCQNEYMNSGDYSTSHCR